MKGRCVICGSVGLLTRDQVPPKGAVPPRPIEVRRLFAAVGGEKSGREAPRRRSQAPTFPSLCSGCNTERLGKLYDPHLIGFAKRLSAWVRSAFQLGLTLPSAATVSVRPLAVARAVVGHLLATEERRDRSAPLVEAPLLNEMRHYFLGTGTSIPAFRVFVWPYTGAEQVIVRGFGNMRVLGRTHGPIVGDVLKFFPLAFWVVGTAPPEVEFPFAQLPLEEDAEVRLNIPLRTAPPYWPERPGEGEVVLLTAKRSYVAHNSGPSCRAR